MASETTVADTSEMEAKLQALFQTMVAEHVVESAQQQQQQQHDTTIPTTTLVLTTDADGNIITQEEIADGNNIAGVVGGQEELIIQEDGTIVRFASQASQQNGDQIIENEDVADDDEQQQQNVTITSHDHTTTTDITTYKEAGEDQQQHLVNQNEEETGDGEKLIVEHGIDAELMEQQQQHENGITQEEGEGGEEDPVKLVFQTSLEKPLQSGILRGLNRLNGFPCQHCPRVLATKYSLMIHTRIHTGEKPHHCTMCPSKFIHPTDLRRHMLKHTGEKPFKCDVCGACFTQTTSLKGHSRQHPGPKPHKCGECGESFVAAVLLRTHERIHNQVQTFKCTHCDETFKSIEQVMEHCQNFHTISVTFDQVQEAMNKNHSSSQKQQQQQQQSEPTALVDVSSIMYGRKRKHRQFPCDECDSVLSTAYSLQIHKRTHTGERPYVCHMCDYRSVCLSMLKRHVLTHSAEKPYSCDQCSKSFRQAAHLKKHQQIHQQQQRQCPKCQVVFPKLSDLVQHWRNRHADPKKPYLCADCFTDFESEELLHEHKREFHVSKKQGEFACDRCGTVFNRKGNLKKHLERVDCGERPFSCDRCSQTFRKKRDVEEHTLREHGVEKDYECKQCHKVFKMEKLLKMHEKRTHGNVKCYCNLCPDRVFNSRKELMEHSNRKHVGRLVQIDVASTTKNIVTLDDSYDNEDPTKDMITSDNTLVDIKPRKGKRHTSKDKSIRSFKVYYHMNGRVEKLKNKSKGRPMKPTITTTAPHSRNKRHGSIFGGVVVGARSHKVPCWICEQRFSTRDEMLKHFQSHRKNPGYFPEVEELEDEQDEEKSEMDLEMFVQQQHLQRLQRKQQKRQQQQKQKQGPFQGQIQGIEHLKQQPQQAVSIQPFQPGQLRATLTTAHHHHAEQQNNDVTERITVGEAVADEDIGNYVLVELMGDQSGNITVSASGADQQATMDAVVKQLLEDTPNSALHQHLNALTTTNAEGENVVELVLNGTTGEAVAEQEGDGGEILMEQQQQSAETTGAIES